MNPFDAEKTKAVWDRVLATQEKAASVNSEGIKNTCHTMPEHQPAADSIQAEEIRDLIQDERTDACTYFALAKCAGGQNGACLQRIGKEELCHAKRLSTVYYVLTGQRACVCPEPTKPVTCLTVSLREQYQKEVDGVQQYLEFARRDSSYQNLFYQLADEEQMHSQRILCMLQEML